MRGHGDRFDPSPVGLGDHVRVDRESAPRPEYGLGARLTRIKSTGEVQDLAFGRPDWTDPASRCPGSGLLVVARVSGSTSTCQPAVIAVGRDAAERAPG